MSVSAKLKGRYELKEVLAKGGMGVVYRAIDGVMRRPVAIKTLLDITDNLGLSVVPEGMRSPGLDDPPEHHRDL
jgi:serine/threonine protein kinase